MTAAAPTIQAIAPANRGGRLRVAAVVAACAAIDAIAAAILLLGAVLPPWLAGIAVAVSHGTAFLLLSDVTRARPSRQWLCGAAMLAVPCLGAAVAAAVVLTRGRGSVAMGRRRNGRRRRAFTPAAILRFGDALSPSQALDCGDGEQRRAALLTLSGRRDPEAIVLLRRAAASRDPDLALSAALVLDEIGERAERQADWPDRGAVRHVAG